MTEVVQLFANPSAGRDSRGALAALARAFEARGARVVLSESAGEPPRIDPRATHVCIAAGDGTVRHVANAVIEAGRPLALSIYPAGTINLLAREAGYPRDPEQFARQVLGSPTRRKHFPVAMRDGHFFACAGVGPDSFAVARVSRRLKRSIGRFAYAVAALKLLFAWQRAAIILDDGARQVHCEAFYVAKGRYYAGGWRLARGARVDEPRLDVVALATARRRDYLRFVALLAVGGDVSRLANVEAFACTTLSARSTAALPLQADGDIVGALPVTFALCEQPLSFC